MKNTLITFFAVGLVSSFALADTPHPSEGNAVTPGDSPRFEISFEQMDTDGNGVLSEQEAAASGIDSEAFQRLDKDASGDLSREELLGVSPNESDPPGTYNPGNGAGTEVDRGTEQRSNEMSPADPSVE